MWMGEARRSTKDSQLTQEQEKKKQGKAKALLRSRTDQLLCKEQERNYHN